MKKQKNQKKILKSSKTNDRFGKSKTDGPHRLVGRKDSGGTWLVCGNARTETQSGLASRGDKKRSFSDFQSQFFS